MMFKVLKRWASVCWHRLTRWTLRPRRLAAVGWRGLLIWGEVTFAKCRLAVLLLLVQTVALVAIPQTHEVLFGLLDPLITFRAAQLPLWQKMVHLLVFGGAASALSFTLWYSARLMATVDLNAAGALNARRGVRRRRVIASAIEWVPRWIGTLSISVSMACLTEAAVATGSANALTLLACFAQPIVIAALVQRLFDRGRPRRLIVVLLVVAALLMAVANGVSLLQLRVQGWASFLTFIGMAVWPAVLHVGLILRRRLIARLWPGSEAASRISPSTPRTLAAVWGRLFSLAVGAFGVLLALGLAGHTLISSASLVMIFLAAFASIGAVAVLFSRRLLLWTQGIAWPAMAALIVLAASRPEPFGQEHLEPIHAAAARDHAAIRQGDAPIRDVVVNAHGGGLRAGFYTALVLAELDDMSCGRFGERLRAVSGVSGGSLGLATYLLARQDLVSRGGWAACVPSRTNPRVLRPKVEQLLRDDHLSPVLAALLTRDLLPGTPQRGQALLDSWQRQYQRLLPSGLSLALPLSELTGGGPDRILAYFSATNPRTGRRVIFSNDPAAISLKINGTPVASILAMPTGLAVLHSARFPGVSPAGQLQAGDDALELVDGGYADNSGAATLRDMTPLDGVRHWIQVDGNPGPDGCEPAFRSSDPWWRWTGVEALLASRVARSLDAQEQLGASIDARGAQQLSLRLSLRPALAMIHKTDAAICEAIKRRRSAPLGWYFSASTAQDVELAITGAYGQVCDHVDNLCDSSPQQ